MTEKGRKTTINEGMLKKGGVNQGQPISQRPSSPQGQGGSGGNSGGDKKS